MTRLATALVLFAGSLVATAMPNTSDVPVVSTVTGRHRPQGVPRASRSMRRLPLRHPIRRAAPVERRSSGDARQPDHDWTAVAQCESSGRWHIVTPPYFGGLQEDAAFWANYGGLAFAARPDLASRRQQVVVAERGLAVQGPGAWPVCGGAL